ncbi:MAG: hypothetical protein RI894_2408 [Bacteroidota bacterium]|jgi:hypothetical protein
MASPYLLLGHSTIPNEVLSSAAIDILHERMKITILPSGCAEYDVVYQIKTDNAGNQIPLLFDTQDAFENFTVKLDEAVVAIKKMMPVHDFSTKRLENQNFWLFKKYYDSLQTDLKYCRMAYFELNLSKGEHTIAVHYTVTGSPAYRRAEEDARLRENYFQYNLKPARFWRSFGGLDIQIFAPESEALRTNLGDENGDFVDDMPDYNQKSTPFKSGASWHFDKLPQDRFSIKYVAPITWRVKTAFAINNATFILWLLATIFLIGLQVWALKKYQYALIWGTLIVPFAVFLLIPEGINALMETIGGEQMMSIDSSGYLLLGLLFLYVITLPFYCGLFWCVRRFAFDVKW